jgi:LDH2 family malate/lactate/ureidoglycolate dehydrogenase
MRYPVGVVLERTAGALRAAGMPPEPAATVAEVMIDADLRGHHSHGVLLLPVYLERIRQGGIDPCAEPFWIREETPVSVLDANGAAGQVAARLAAERSAAIALQAGVGVVAVRHSNHVGMLAAYRAPFERTGVVGLILNLAGTSVAPPGGQRPTMGNNAVCLVVPRGEQEAFSVDFATGAVACGKIRQAALQGTAVPEGWLLDRDGAPSTDPVQLDEGGAVPVFGGHKGLALSLMIEILAGAIGGGVTSRGVNRQRLWPDRVMDCSQLFVGFLPSAFGIASMAPFLEELEAAVRDSYVSGPPALYFPEQYEAQARKEAERDGLRIEPEVAGVLGLC